MAFIYDLADTWNDAGTVFNGIKLNVTDTASASGSLLMDLQVGGVSKFSVSKTGSAAAKNIQLSQIGANIEGFGIGSGSTGFLAFGYASVPSFVAGSTTMTLNPNAKFGWASVAVPNMNVYQDLVLARDAANTLAQRNSTNAQTFNLYNTYTDASNYERGFMKWNSNVLEIGTEAAGTGSARSTRLVSASQMIISPASNVMFIPNGGGSQVYIVPNTGTVYGNAGLTLGNSNNALNLRPGSTNGVSIAGNFIEAGEMTAPSAPSTDKVRIYAEDNGSGKTRLMALFPTGAAQQIAIEP